MKADAAARLTQALVDREPVHVPVTDRLPLENIAQSADLIERGHAGRISCRSPDPHATDRSLWGHWFWIIYIPWNTVSPAGTQPPMTDLLTVFATWCASRSTCGTRSTPGSGTTTDCR